MNSETLLRALAGTSPMETLEKIAENLEIRVGGVISQPLEYGVDVAWFDLGRG